MKDSEKTIVGYADRLSAAPGGVVALKVSAWGEAGHYDADLVRLLCGDGRGDGARFVEEAVEGTSRARYPARRQAVEPGSHARIEGLPPLGSFSLVLALWPTALGPGERCLVSTGSGPAASAAGFSLSLDATGAAVFRLGDGKRSDRIALRTPLALRRWTLLGVSYDNDTGHAALHARPQPVSPGNDAGAHSEEVTGTFSGGGGKSAFSASTTPLWIGVRDEGARRCDHVDGKIGALRIVSRPLDAASLWALADATTPTEPDAQVATLVGFWDFAAAMDSDRLADRGPRGLEGTLVQLPTRAVTGHRWNGEHQNWRHQPSHYDAIHFHSDDLCDAGWDTDFEWKVPENLRSGIYALRLRQGDSIDHVPVFVRPPRGRATAEVAFLVPTATYLAYANQRLMLRPSTLFPKGGATSRNANHLAEHPDYGGSLYEKHRDGSGVHYSSCHRPILNLKPKGEMWAFGADTNISAWLEWTGIPYDVITDEDLHHEGESLLRPYRGVVTGTHPEYHSTAMHDALGGYLQRGGRLMYLGGNGFYWRIAFSPHRRGIIEVRRSEDGTRTWAAESGESYHSFNGEYGGLWRRLGRPPQQLVGVGFAAQGFDGGRPYERLPASRDPRVAFMFEGLEGIDTLGAHGNIGGGAAGEEIDRCDFALGSPAHTLVVASCQHHAPGMLRTKEEFLVTMPQRSGDPKVRADMVFFECPQGGAVFSTGSIAYAGALAHNDYDNEICRLTTNVLRRFCDSEPFPDPGDPQ